MQLRELTKRHMNLFHVLNPTITLFLALILCQSNVMAQVNELPENYDDLKLQGLIPQLSLATTPFGMVNGHGVFQGETDRDFCFIEHNPATWTELPSNDDESSSYIPLPFEFEMYGSVYNGLYVNNNGNITFDSPLSMYIPEGLPLNVPMIAPMWCDVDTRYADDGEVWYFVGPNYFIASYIETQVYVSGSYPWLRNTFQVVISDGTDEILTGSNNIGFFYGDMNWTTGDASSGTNGFGGEAATVGINSGNGVDYLQVGLFSLDNENYDGPFGNDDGVHWLDNLCLEFNVGTVVNQAPVAQLAPSNLTICSNENASILFEFTGPEADQNVFVEVIDENNSGVGIINNSGSISSTTLNADGISPGTYDFTLLVSDDGDPIASLEHLFTLTVEDCCEPSIELECPLDVELSCGSFSTPDITGIPNVITSECWLDEFSQSFSDEILNQDDCQIVVARTWEVIGGEENLSCVQLISLNQDFTPPVFDNFMSNVELSCEEELVISEPTVTDNCSDVIIEFTEELLDEGCLGVLRREYRAVDACGNVTLAEQFISFIDDVAPSVQAPDNMTIGCDELANLEVPAPVVTDNCDFNPTIVFSESSAPGFCINAQNITWTWTATDACGNQSEATTQVQVLDLNAPFFENTPNDTIISCDAEVPPITFPEALDNCSEVVSVTLDEDTIPGDCPQEFTINRIFRAFDECGNSGMFVQVIEIVDTVAPVFDPFEIEIDIACDQVDQFSLDASDNCGVVELNYSDLQFSGGCAGTIYRTYTATDGCGNTTQAEQIIHLVDNEAPQIINFPVDQDLSCEAFAAYEIPELLVIDNCDDEPELSYLGEQMTGDTCNFTLTHTWLTEDQCGNELEHELVLTVSDFTAPFFLDFPDDILLECGQTPPPVELPQAQDLCDTDVDVFVTVMDVPGECEDSQDQMRIFRGVDNCGNQVMAVQNINYINPPQFPDLFEAEGDVLLYPNPSKGEVSVISKIPFGKKVAVSVFDNLGTVVWKAEKQFSLTEQNDLLKLDLSDLKNGKYSVMLESEKVVTRLNLIVIK